MSELPTIINRLNQIENETGNDEKQAPSTDKSWQEYQQLIDDLPEAYVEYDLKGRITYMNKAMLMLCSRNKKELKNLSYKNFTDPQTAVEACQIYNEVYRTGVPKSGYVHEIIRKDGKKMILEGSIFLKKVNGKATGFRGIWHNVTERKKIETELLNHQNCLEAILGSVKEAIIALDAHGYVIKANAATENICGVSVQTVTGKHYAEIEALCDKSCHGIIKETLSTGTEIKEHQIVCRRHDRPHQVVVFNSAPLVNADGRAMGAVLVVRDITEIVGLEKELKGRYKFQQIIGKSDKMQAIYDLLETLANLETTVLITGESGTGKELAAKALHDAGERKHMPLVKVNCSALSESLLESELFGHVKGAFTGAFRDRRGRFEAADGGTILLDEIGDISPLIQLKLLRVLQDKNFDRVGESASRIVDVRVIAATNKDLKEKVKKGEFREDLYYRLKVMEITLPALRDRLEDLPLLVNHFCQLLRRRLKKDIEGVSDEVLSLLMKYAWPGNVRELEHALEHAFVLCNGRSIKPGHLPHEVRELSGIGRKRPLSSPGNFYHDAQVILDVLQKTGWNKTKAAALLGVNRRTIHRKIKQYDLRK